MKRNSWIWYFLIMAVALGPAATRLALWQKVGAPAVARVGEALPVEPAMAQAGEALFKHEWQVNDPLCPEGDGLGPVCNARSCVACHNQGGVGGGGAEKHNVTTFVVRTSGQAPRQGVVHAFSIHGDTDEKRRETLAHVDSSLPEWSRPTLEQLSRLANPLKGSEVHVSQRNTPALFGAKLIDDIPERVILAGAKSQKVKWGMASPENESVPVGRAARLPSGRIGRFGWKGQMASLSDFVRAACANELGLGNPGQPQPTPLYADASYRLPGLDLTARQCDELTAFCASLPKPVERRPDYISEEKAAAGKELFSAIGCADCHTPKLGNVEGIYSDLLLHRMGQALVGGGSYGGPRIPAAEKPEEGPSPSEWRTPPLWGVADSAPYLHDGRADTLEEAVQMHGGQGRKAARKFATLSGKRQEQLIAFLQTLRAP